MAKNPAVLWYPADYLVGVIGMSWEDQGRYTYLLNVQHQHGHLDINKVMPDCPQSVLDKFVQDEDGLYYNERMEAEQEKRNKYVDSRRKNAKGEHMQEHMQEHMPQHMENENENKELDINNNSNPNPPTPLPCERSDEIGDTVKGAVDHLNMRAGTHYRYGSRQTRDKVAARLNEGFTLDDFIVVIDKKCAEWIGTEHEKYLRPETLFGPKFEGYLNQKTSGHTKNKFAAMLGVSV